MNRRLYPFGEPAQPSGTTSSNCTYDAPTWTWCQMRPNPFHGWQRWMFAFDEWGHRHNLNARGPLRWLCNWWDRRLWKD